jgi:hypothetical protein
MGNSQNIAETPSVSDSTEKFDFVKERVERAKNQTEKAILAQLGVNSLSDVKQKFTSLENFKKDVENLKNELSKAKLNEYKIELLKSGFDERFLNFAVSEINEKVTENKNFLDILEEYKKENPQFLKQNDFIKMKTAPNLTEGAGKTDENALMNAFIRGKG